MVRYHKENDEYILLSVRPVKGSKDNEYKAYKTILKKENTNPVTTMLSSASLNRIANRHFEKKDQFLAIPQNLYVNEDDSYTIVFEENLMKSSTYSDFSTSGFSSTRTRNTFFLNDTGIISYDKDGMEKGGFYIPKSQKVLSLPNMIYYSYREESATILGWGLQYKSFFYLNGKNQNYVFINDIEKNQEEIDDKRRVITIQGLEDCEAYSFAINKGIAIPKRQLIFTDKQKGKGYSLIYSFCIRQGA